MQPSPLIGYGEFGDGVGTIPFSDGTYGVDSKGEIKVVTEGEAKGADCIISDPDADSDAEPIIIPDCLDERTFEAALVFVFRSSNDCLTSPSTVLMVSISVFCELETDPGPELEPDLEP